MSKLNIISIIGMRSGSKSIVNKNIKPIAGKPLIKWIIEASLASSYVDRTIVSTNSKEYAKIAKDAGAEIPHLRPQYLSSDTNTDFEYVEEMVNYLEENENFIPDYVVRLMPTSPLQLAEDIDLAIEKLIKNPKADSCVVVAKGRQSPMKAMKIVKNKENEILVPYVNGGAVEPLPRQDMTESYFRSNVVVTTPENIKKTKSLTGKYAIPHIIDFYRGIDIDNQLDFEIAEFLLENLNYFKKKGIV